jgi:uncharacterized protein (TIGR02145 family)
MKKLIYILQVIVAVVMIINAFGQNQITFTFTGMKIAAFLQLDSIRVRDITQGGDTVLFYPDTVLILNMTGIGEPQNLYEGFRMMQNFPNPVEDRTEIGLYVPEKDRVCLTVTNVMGQRLVASEKILKKGYHTFRFTPAGEELYLLTAWWKGTSRTIRILHLGAGSVGLCSLEYMGYGDDDAPLKSSGATQEFSFSPGDELLCIGYADTLESGFRDAPETSRDFVFQFATKIPCPGIDSILYEGQWYHTIQIFSQCWMEENLNVGMMIPSSQSQTNNDTIEKYCMGNSAYYCDITGGLYFWNEMMKYTGETGGQGICPEGWHVPRDLDWQILEGAVDSLYKIGDTEWGNNNWRGSNAGGNLKQTGTEFWVEPNTGATDAFGFTALPGGYFVQNAFWGIGYKAYFWSSQLTQKYYRDMDYDRAMINRNPGGGGAAFSVRCIRN